MLLNSQGLRDQFNMILVKGEAFIAEALGTESHKDLPPSIAFGDITLWVQVALIVIMLVAIALTLRTWYDVQHRHVRNAALSSPLPAL